MNPTSSPTFVRGIDVSHYQGFVDWDKVKASGIQFAFLKATEGERFVDSSIARNIDECARVGIPYGCYHFLTEADVDAQVTRFCSIAPSAAPLPPVLDFEDPILLPAMALEWLNKVTAWCGRAAILYSDPAVIRNTMNTVAVDSTDFTQSPLWIAHYNVPKPRFDPWDKWTFWQYESGGSVPGISTPVDLDYFNGTQAEW